jgi:hypothetical protein
MDKRTLEKAYSSLLKDLDFGRLGLILKQPNIFSALGISQHEIRHSNFLAWLLNPNESHGLNDLFLNRFLRDILLDERCTEISLFELPELNLSNTSIFREWQNIDLLVQIDNLVIAIENKVYSNEHSDQLARYKELIETHFVNEKKLFVYLTPFGDESSANEFYINYSYERIVEILSELLELYRNSFLTSTAIYISDYINALKLFVMENSPANDLALKIYKNHKELLDFIIEMKPDSIRQFDEILREFILAKGYVLGSQSKGYVRFLPKEIYELIPKGYSKGWQQKESLLIEIVNWSDKKIAIKAVISPGDENTRQLLVSIFKNINGYKIPSGSQWLTYFQINLPLNYEMVNEMSKSELIDKLELEWNKVLPMVSKVSQAILERKQDFLELNKKNISDE